MYPNPPSAILLRVAWKRSEHLPPARRHLERGKLIAAHLRYGITPGSTPLCQVQAFFRAHLSMTPDEEIRHACGAYALHANQILLKDI